MNGGRAKSQFPHNITLEERPLPDVTPDHLLGLVPDLVHDLVFILSSLGGRDSAAGAQRRKQAAL